MAVALPEVSAGFLYFQFVSGISLLCRLPLIIL
jgi:hypothetical protein